MKMLKTVTFTILLRDQEILLWREGQQPRILAGTELTAVRKLLGDDLPKMELPKRERNQNVRQLVTETLQDYGSPLTLAELQAFLPQISNGSLSATLHYLKKAGIVTTVPGTVPNKYRVK